MAGERFWLVVYPRQIKSLRHVWEHPAFPPSGETGVGESDAPDDDPVAASTKWIEEFAARIDQTVSRVMTAAEDWLDGGEYTYDNTEAYKDSWDEFPEFWKHYSVVTGKPTGEKDECFFTCSC
jgi:hypothetical protein